MDYGKVFASIALPITDAQRDRYEAVKKLHYQVSPFYAHLFLILTDQLSKKLPGGFVNPTSATNGKGVYVNPDFLMQLSLQEGDTLLCHEVAHVMLKHPWRRPKLLQFMESQGMEKCQACCNMAEDLVINNMLLEDKKTPLPAEWPAWDTQYKGLSTTDVVPKVYKLYHDKHKCPTCGKGDGTHEPPPGDGQEEQSQQGGGSGSPQEGPQDSAGAPQTGSGGSGGTKGRGKGRGRSSGAQGASQGGQAHGRCGTGGCCEQAEDTSQAEVEEVERQIDEAILKAARVAKARGTVPAFAQILVDEVTQTRLNWREKLRKWFDGKTPSDFSWARPSRQGLTQGVYLPRFSVESLGEIVVIVDTSGSTADLLPVFTSELKAIFAECRPFRLHVIYVDAAVAGHDVFDRAEEMEIKHRGGGGTSFRPGFDYIVEQGIEPRGIVYFTDGYGDWPELQDPGVETLWVTDLEDDKAREMGLKFGEHVTIRKDE